MIIEFLQLYRLPDGRLYRAGQIGMVDDAAARELIARHIAREYIVPDAGEEPPPEGGGGAE